MVDIVNGRTNCISAVGASCCVHMVIVVALSAGMPTHIVDIVRGDLILVAMPAGQQRIEMPGRICRRFVYHRRIWPFGRIERVAVLLGVFPRDYRLVGRSCAD